MQELVIASSVSMERPSWAVIGADNVQRAYLIQLKGWRFRSKKWWSLCPEDVLLTAAHLPKMNQSRFMQALPYALEEQLIEEVENLHFAIGEYQPDAEIGVAIVSHAKMQQWLLLLQAWGVKAGSLMPLTHALPQSDGAWHVFIHDMAVWRTTPLQGLVCDKNNFPSWLELAFSASPAKPAQITIHNYSSSAVADTIHMPVPCNEECLPASEFIADTARFALSTPYINLLQGQYAIKRSRLPQFDQLTRTVFNLAKVVLLLLFLYPLGSLFILNHRVRTIDQEIAAIYKQQFPQASSVVAPKIRMQEKLNKLETQLISEDRLFLLLGFIGKGMQETKNIKLKRLDFQNNQVTLALTAASTDDFSAFTDFLTNKG